MSEIRSRNGGRVPSRHGNAPSHTDQTLPFTALLRSIANKVEIQEESTKPKALWGQRAGSPKKLISDDLVREIRKRHEIDGIAPKQLWIEYSHLLLRRGYLDSLLSYQTRSLIFPEDTAETVRK